MALPRRPPIDDVEQLRRLGEMLVDLNEAERLLTRIQRLAMELGEDDLVHVLDGELFWKLRELGDQLRDTSTWSASTAGTCRPRAPCAGAVRCCAPEQRQSPAGRR